MEGLTVFEQIKLFVFLIPFILLCIACYKINLPQRIRGRQVLMPVLAILLSIYAIFKIQQLTSELHDYLEYVFSLIDKPVQQLSGNAAADQIINDLLGTTAANNEISEAIKNQFAGHEVSESIQKTLARIKSLMGDAFDLNLLIAYIVNFSAITIFMLIKGILLPILSRVWSNDELMKLTADRWYDYHELPPGYYDRHGNSKKNKGKKDTPKKDNAKEKKANDNDEELSGWFVKPQTTSYYKLLLAAYVGIFVAVSLVFLVSVFHPEWAFFKASFYPVFIIIVFGEVVAFLNGLLFVEEPVKSKIEAPKREPLNPNYRKIWEDFRNIYPDSILRRTPDILEDTSLPEPPKTDKDLSFLTQSDDENLKTVAMLFENLNDLVEPSYAEGCLRLLQGKSTLFCNPFYEDLDRYLFPPIIYNLLSYKKCLFIMGRDSTADDFCDWLKKGIKDFVGADGLWQTEIISKAPVNFDLGILKFSDIYNLEVLNAHREFFSEVRFVFILEPSKILATGQLALSLVISQLASDQRDAITYCACDHNCDGLVDCLSHALKTSMIHVIATLLGNGSNLQVFWDADSQNMQYKILKNVTHYLGIGTEISLIGMRNGVCNLVPVSGNEIAHQNECWFSCDKFPIMDMMWIAGQYYNQICEYTNENNNIKIPIGQEQFNKALEVRSNIWHCPKAESTYLIVEDEYNNLFEMSRIFSSRSIKEGFVNVISGHYLLRDYMIEYIDLFQSDAKAIPTVVPDYARTERNVILKLLMMMTAQPLSEEFVRQELRQAGLIETVKGDQDTNKLKNRAKRSKDLFEQFKKHIARHLLISEMNNGLKLDIKDRASDDGFTVEKEYFYAIEPGDNPIHRYLKKLTNAFFISEDEAENKHFISAKLYGHVLQSYLPGQFITVDGKYYQVMSISEKNGITLRRAADHIHKRLYYRQVRDILLKKWSFDDAMGACHHITFTSGMKMQIARGFADYDVKAPGYLECAPYNDIKHARYFELDKIYDDVFICSEPLKLRKDHSIHAEILAEIGITEDEKTKKKQANKFLITDRYHGWYKTEYQGQTGWIYPKSELDRYYSHKMALRLRLPRISQDVIDYKLEDIENSSRTEAEALRRECAAIDKKAEEAIKASLGIQNKSKKFSQDEKLKPDQIQDKVYIKQIQDEAYYKADKAKELVKEKAVANQAACLKLRDALKNCIANEEKENQRLGDDAVQGIQNSDVAIQKDEDPLKDIKDIFSSLNNPEVIERVRFTLCLMLSEIFKTTYPDAWQYINVVTEVDSELLTGNLKYANYHFVDESSPRPTKNEDIPTECETTADAERADTENAQSVENAVEAQETPAEISKIPNSEEVCETKESRTSDGTAEISEIPNAEEVVTQTTEMPKTQLDSTDDLSAETTATQLDTSEDVADTAEWLSQLSASDFDWESLDHSDAEQGENLALDNFGHSDKEPDTIEQPSENDKQAVAEADTASENESTSELSTENEAVPETNESSSQAQASCTTQGDSAEGSADATDGIDTPNEDDSQQGYIYVLEDSEIDLGLTVSVERYLDKYFEIIYDVLVWHNQKMKAGLDPSLDDDVTTDVEFNLNVKDDSPEKESEEKSKGLLARFIEWLKSLFGSKKPAPVEKPEDNTDPIDVIHEDKPLNKPLRNYVDQCFLKYGDTKFDRALAIKETIAYLGLLGYDANRFDKARLKAQETRNKKEAEAENRSGNGA